MRAARWLPLAAGVAFLASALAPAARAQAPAGAPAPPGTQDASLADQLPDRAGQSFRAGSHFLQGRNYATALQNFRDAYKFSNRDARVLWNIAICEKGLQRFADAQKTLEQYSGEMRDRVSPQRRMELDHQLDLLRTKVSVVTLLVTPDGTQVSVNGNPVGQSPFRAPLRLDPGPKAFRFSREGYEPKTVQTDLIPGTPVALPITLESAARPGRLIVDAGGKGLITVNGEPRAYGSWDGPLPAGTYVVDVTEPGMWPHHVRVALKDGETQRLHINLVPKPVIWPWVAGAAVLLGAATGGYFLLRDPGKAPVDDGTWSPGKIQLP